MEYPTLSEACSTIAQLDGNTLSSVRLACSMFRYLEPDYYRDTSKPMQRAIRQGYIEIIPLLEALGYEIPEDAIELAVSTCQLDITQYLVERGFELPADICIQAVETGKPNLEILQWLRNQHPDCFDLRTVVRAAVKRGAIWVLEWLKIELRSVVGLDCLAMRKKIFQIVRWLADNGYEVYWPTLAYIAVKLGSVPSIEWLSQQCKIEDNSLIVVAAVHGHLPMLKWLHRHGLHSDHVSCDVAIRLGNFEMLKWLYKHNFRWDISTLGMAVLYGNSIMLRWLLENGCPKTADATTMAIREDKFDLFLLLVGYDCPYDYQRCLSNVKDDELERELVAWYYLTQ